MQSGPESGEFAGLILAALVGRFVRFHHVLAVIKPLFRSSRRRSGGRAANPFQQKKRRSKRVA